MAGQASMKYLHSPFFFQKNIFEKMFLQVVITAEALSSIGDDVLGLKKVTSRTSSQSPAYILIEHPSVDQIWRRLAVGRQESHIS